MKLAMGCDPAAYRFYKKLLERMKEEGYDIVVAPGQAPGPGAQAALMSRYVSRNQPEE